MGMHRLIKKEEKELITFLIEKIGHYPKQYDLDVLVDEYEGGKMGSISFCLDGAATYAGDLIQVDYVDNDGVEVVITLTHDINNNLLDFDFWKMDFSKLIAYPRPNQVTLNY